MGDLAKGQWRSDLWYIGRPIEEAPKWGRVTQKPGRLYLHVFDWPVDGKLLLPISNKVTNAYLLMRRAERSRPRHAITAWRSVYRRLAIDPMASVIVAKVEGDVQPLDAVAVSQTPDGTIQLSVVDAEIVGSDAKLYGSPEQNLGYWTNSDDYVQWRAKVVKPGDFAVTIKYACEPGSAGSEYKLVIGEKSIRGKISATGGWDDYKLAELGPIRIDQPGTVTITVKPTKKPGLAVMNLHR